MAKQGRYLGRLFGLVAAALVLSVVLAACQDGSSPTTQAPTIAATTSAVVTTAALTTVTATTAPAQTTSAPVTTSAPTTQAVPSATVAPSTNATATTAAITTASATIVPATTVNPTTQAATPTPAADTSKPGYIASLRARTYTGGPIKLGRVYEQNAKYKANLITYPSDDLTISGLMFVPTGPGPFPVALINHGYFAFNDYGPGWDTLRELRYFANNGYVTIASDYRNYGTSSKGDHTIQPGYTIDILNLIASVKQTSYIDPKRITIMGHSMGGEITLDTLVVSKDIRVAALFGSMSADAADNYYARRDLWHSTDTGPYTEYYGTPDKNPDVYRKLSPLTYFEDVSVPVIIHSGTKDITTPPAWSHKIFSELQKLGKPSEIYDYPGETHSLNGAAFDLAMSRTLAFFNRAIGKS